MTTSDLAKLRAAADEVMRLNDGNVRCGRFGTLTGYKLVSHKPNLALNAEIESSGRAANGTGNN
jgi:hypothetical protein